MRSDDDSQLTGGIRRWWEWHGLLPKLGLFHESEKEIPYDFVDLLKSISDRPFLVYSATNDRQVTPSDVVAAVNEAKMRAGGNLQFHHVQDVNRFQSDQHKILLEWLARIR
jgi:CRISPR/Cas system-associated endonuclease Cas1